jgi:hypothetical protein
MAQPIEVLARPLWPDGKPVPTWDTAWDAFKSRPDPEGHWSFWVRWYQGFLDQAPMDWELQRRVALGVGDKTWGAGVEAVAGRIAEIEAEYYAEKLPQAENLEKDAETGLYEVKSVTVDADTLRSSILSQVQFSVETAIAGGNTSGFSTMCVAYKYIRHTLDNCRTDANAIEGNLSIAAKLIRDGLANGKYSKEDGLEGLLHTLDRQTVQMRAQHPEVRQAWEKRVEQTVRESTDDQRKGFANSVDEVRRGTKTQLNEEFELDAATIRANESNEAVAEAVKRSGGRAAVIAVKERVDGAIKKADSSSTYKGFKLYDAAQKAIELLSGLF